MAISSQDVIIDQQPILTDGSATTQPVSGTVTANAGTGTFTVDGSGVTQPVSGTVTANAGTGTFTVDGSGVTQPVSGTVAVSSVGGTVAVTQSTSPWVVSGSVTIGVGSTATITQVTVTNAVSVTLLAANASRKKFIISMPTVGTALYIGFTATTSTTNFTYKLVTNNSVIDETNYTGIVTAIAVGASDLVTITEIV